MMRYNVRTLTPRRCAAALMRRRLESEFWEPPEFINPLQNQSTCHACPCFLLPSRLNALRSSQRNARLFYKHFFREFPDQQACQSCSAHISNWLRRRQVRAPTFRSSRLHPTILEMRKYSVPLDSIRFSASFVHDKLGRPIHRASNQVAETEQFRTSHTSLFPVQFRSYSMLLNFHNI